MKGRNNRLSLKSRQSVYGNILVGLSFMALTFLTVKTFAPDASSNAENIEASAGSSSYAASISTSDTTPINITPTSTQETFTGQNSITYTNACPYGFTVSMSANSENPGLERTGTDSGIKSIPTISSGTTLTDNTWGYSLDNGGTYNPVPSISSPAIIIDTASANTDPASLSLTYGVRINNSIPAGAYSKDVIYTVSVRPQCIVYDLKWDLNGGTGASGVSYDDTEINYGHTFNLENYTPTRTGYTFTGWKSSATGNTFAADSGTIDVNPTNAMEVTLTAQWTPTNYTISCTLNGGSATNPTSYNIETNTITLNNPTRTGYTFAGWTGSNGTTKQTTVTIPKGSTGNKSYTANWTPVTYTISYTLNGGSVSGNPTNYTIESNTITLKNPTRDGYTFAGWTGSNGSTKQTTVTIPKGSTGNKSYTANWNAICASGTTAGILNLATNGQKTYSYSGKPVCEVIKNAGRYKLEVWGAQGGSTYGTGGLGGYSVGTLTVAAQKPLYVYVGGQPTTYTTGGWNGGGAGRVSESSLIYDSAGGGASDFRYNGTALSKRVIVAGGGGGGVRFVDRNHNPFAGTGGAGGGTNSGKVYYVIYGDNSATQSSNIGASQTGYANNDVFNFPCGNEYTVTKATVEAGSLGQGATSAGGGYYGGTWFGNCNLVYTGSGGSGYIGGVSGGSTTAGQRSGNGYARITYLGN